MNTLTLSPDIDPKDQNRQAYARGDRKQDHATATAGVPKMVKAYREVYGNPKKHRDTRLADLALMESTEDYADRLRSMSPQQLTGLASTMLERAGFVDEEPEVSFLSDHAVEEDYDIDGFNAATAEWEDWVDPDEELESGSLLDTQHEFKNEYLGYLAQRRKAANDVYRQEVGHTDRDDEDLYTDMGMHPTSRP